MKEKWTDAGERHSGRGQGSRIKLLQLAIPCTERVDMLVVWRPVIDCSSHNCVTLTNFKMETVFSSELHEERGLSVLINPFSSSPFFGQVQKFFLENLLLARF